MADAPSTGGTAAETATPTTAPAQEGQAEVKSETLQTAEREPRKSRTQLPGVLSSDADNDVPLAKKLFGAEDEVGDGDRKARVRDEAGRFVKQAKDAAESDAKKPALPEGVEPPPEPAPKFKFGGEEWESQEKAEQNFRTLRGMHRANEARLKEVSSSLSEFARANDLWKSHADQLSARIAELERGNGHAQPQPSAQVSATEEPKSLSDEEIASSIDWDAYNYIATKGSLAKGGEYLIGEVMRLVRENIIPDAVGKLRSELMQQMVPITQDRERAETVEAMTRATQQLSALKTPDGRVAFPELQDAAIVEKIGYLWAREAQDEQDLERRARALRTPQGLMSAIALYRLIDNLEQAPTAQPAPVAVPSAPPVAPGPAASLSVRGDEGFALRARTGLSPAQARLAAELGKSQLIDPQLGFARNR